MKELNITKNKTEVSISSNGEGFISQSESARLVGLPRSTVRSWILRNVATPKSTLKLNKLNQLCEESFLELLDFATLKLTKESIVLNKRLRKAGIRAYIHTLAGKEDQSVISNDKILKLESSNEAKDKEIAVLKDELALVTDTFSTATKHLKLFGIKNKAIVNIILDIVTDRVNQRLIRVPKFDRAIKYGFEGDVQIISGKLYDTVLMSPDAIETCLIHLDIKY